MYKVTFDTDEKFYKSKSDALRNGAILAKVHNCVTKVFGPAGNFIKSFDPR